jgi:hypothetical protein
VISTSTFNIADLPEGDVYDLSAPRTPGRQETLCCIFIVYFFV